MELLDVYDNYGNITGRTIVRGDKTALLNENEHIAVRVTGNPNEKKWRLSKYNRTIIWRWCFKRKKIK